jgi:GTP-binding protein HflX
MKPTYYDTAVQPEQACLVGFDIVANMVDGVNISLAELEALTTTAGVIPAVTVMSKRRGVNPKFFIGSGKVNEIKQACKDCGLHLVIFDHDLTPAQTRNLEQELNQKIVDRTGLILEIFAQHAMSREGKLQVELAQLEYLLPRLTRLWTHLSRQYGGLGTRGPGEKQLEVDRRRVQTRISRLHALLETVRKQRATQRKRRNSADVPVIAIVGYTNAGKSTLLQSLTKADVLIEDKLFATLDPTTRLYTLPNQEKFVFIDTVGFIRNLPHTLVEAFKATLEETQEADVLVHITDASASDLYAQIDAVHDVLQELNADSKPQLLVLNKTDTLSHRRKKELQAMYPHAAYISAKYKYGFSDMFEKLRPILPGIQRHTTLRLPPHKSALLSKLHKQAKVLSTEYLEDAILVEAVIPENLKHTFHRYRVKQVSS